MLQKLLWIALGGALGTLSRYGLTSATQRWLGPGFPWGTAVVNVIGCFLFGALYAFALGRWNLGADARTVIFVGFIGAFTTFSTFVSETGHFLSNSEMLMGMGNVVFQVVAGIGVFFLGLAVGRTI
jgi:CrcB protein